MIAVASVAHRTAFESSPTRHPACSSSDSARCASPESHPTSVAQCIRPGNRRSPRHCITRMRPKRNARHPQAVLQSGSPQRIETLAPASQNSKLLARTAADSIAPCASLRTPPLGCSGEALNADCSVRNHALVANDQTDPATDHCFFPVYSWRNHAHLFQIHAAPPEHVPRARPCKS
jgi:hypothetical protein